jgi:protein-S-isoprenylcysteine O-methyltransferase Ste14
MRAPLAPAVFGTAAVLTGAAALDAAQHAVANPNGRTALVGLYCLLRACVAVAFAMCTLGRRAPHKESRQPLAIAACALAVTAVVAMSAPKPGTPQELSLAGELIAVVFAIWLLVSVATLGRCFGVLPEARGLVTRGPYRWVRHPVYLGELGACAGLVIASPTLANATLLGLFGAAQAVRMRFEERALAGAFPEYAEYAARTSGLVPRVRLFRTARFDSTPHLHVD